MKTELVILDGELIVRLTPESKYEDSILKTISGKDLKVSIYKTDITEVDWLRYNDRLQQLTLRYATGGS